MSFKVHNTSLTPSNLKEPVDILLQNVDKLEIVPGGDFIYTMSSGVLNGASNSNLTVITAPIHL